MRKKYGLLTAISMVVGIVVGSGIFFKTDDILRNTNGSVSMGVVVFIIGAVGIIFGGLAIATLSNENDTAGGMVTYLEMLHGKFAGKLAGYFYLFVYNPAISAIISWVGGMYLGMLLGYEPLSTTHWLVTIVIIVGLFVMNLVQEKLGGQFQTILTGIKLALLFIVAILGFIYGKAPVNISDVTLPTIMASSSALVAVAFSYDGWFLSTSISHEVRNTKRNMPLALIIGPLIVMGIYVAYFLGITSVLSPDKIIALGDGHVAEAASLLLGANGYKIILIGVTLSVIGAANGVILGLIRIPYSLAIRNELPKSNVFSKLSKKSDMPIASGLMSLACTMVWLLIHYVSCVVPSLAGFDISNLPIIINYFSFEALYLGLIYRNFKNKKYGIIKGIIIPIFAALGGMLILYGGFKDPFIIHYLVVSIVILVVSLLIEKYTRKSI